MHHSLTNQQANSSVGIHKLSAEGESKPCVQEGEIQMALGVEPPHPPSPPGVLPLRVVLGTWTLRPFLLRVYFCSSHGHGSQGLPLFSDAAIATHAPERTDRIAEEFGDGGGRRETRSLQRQDRKVGYGGEPEGRPQRGSPAGHAWGAVEYTEPDKSQC